MKLPNDVGSRPDSRPKSSLRRASRSTYALLFLGIALLLVVGVAVLPDYGPSVDEWQNAYYGRVFLETYRTDSLLRPPGIAYFNGPFYFMIFTLTARLFQHLQPDWLFTDGIHLTNFLTFLVGLFFFYRLASRMMPRWLALFVTALFATQPVLFGHAFINQKDTPLMVFFLASVELGWTAVETRLSVGPRPPQGREGRGSAEEWSRLTRVARVLIVAGGVIGLMLLADLWWLGTLQNAARSQLSEVYGGRGPRVLVELFGLVAQDMYKTPLRAYQAKLDALFSTIRWVSIPLFVLTVLVVWRVAFPLGFSNSASRWFRQWGGVLLAGCVVGVTTSIRALGPFAGVLVAGYWIGREGRRAIPALLAYGLAAAVATYLTWPVLWGNPLIALTQRASALGIFAGHWVLFQGELYKSGNLPWPYLPTLLAVQLTLPCLLLFLVGIPYSWILSRADRVRRMLVALSWLWLLLPSATIVLGLVPAYQNFRHVLFALPPAFLVMGFGAWKLAGLARRPVLQAGLAVLALVPGIVGIIRLHPYEYIYYNELVGGVRGAAGRFDLDYFCTASRRAMDVVNQAADPEDWVAFSPNFLAARMVARQDLRLQKAGPTVPDPDFAVACHRDARQSSFYPEMKTIYEVRVEGAPLALVKQRAEAP